MAEIYDELNQEHLDMIKKQAIFFVATAAEDGRVNLSPKGYDCFKVLGPNHVAYLDLSGSGNETHAHLIAKQKDAGRITIMFNNFSNPAAILRLYGIGRPVLPQDDDWDNLARNFHILPGTRQIFDITVNQVQTSCGYGVPKMKMVAERETLIKLHRQSDPDTWLQTVKSRSKSIDGLNVRTTKTYFSGDN